VTPPLANQRADLPKVRPATLDGRYRGNRRRQGAVLPVYMSGYADDAIMRHGVLEASTAFLAKPFTLETLLREVREVLDGR
jgi:DNA-binding response OmpR family regulator